MGLMSNGVAVGLLIAVSSGFGCADRKGGPCDTGCESQPCPVGAEGEARADGCSSGTETGEYLGEKQGKGCNPGVQDPPIELECIDCCDFYDPWIAGYVECFENTYQASYVLAAPDGCVPWFSR